MKEFNVRERKTAAVSKPNSPVEIEVEYRVIGPMIEDHGDIVFSSPMFEEAQNVADRLNNDA
jgi:hypothetical protein